MSVLDDILGERPVYQDRGAGADNATVLRAAGVRPAFFDTSCIMYRLMHAKADTYVKNCGIDTDKIAHHVAADVMADIADACRNFASAPVMAFDSDTSHRRDQLYPGYKRDRDKQKLSANKMTVLGCKKEVIRLLRRVYAPGYRVQGFCVHGYEGDDIIASFVLGLKQVTLMGGPEYDKIVVAVSSDHDLHQIIMEGVKFADVTTGVLCDADDIHKHTKIHPRDLVASKCIGGCKSDKVGNVPSCGDVTVAEFLRIRSFDVTLPKAKAALLSPEGEQILRRNLRLVRLPFEGEPPMPPLRLSNVWPKAGIPDSMAALMDSNGVPRSAWPSFADITLPRAEGAIPVCAYNKKGG